MITSLGKRDQRRMKNRQQKEFAFLEFESIDAARNAMDNMNNKEVNGDIVEVSIAMNRRKTSQQMREQYQYVIN